MSTNHKLNAYKKALIELNNEISTYGEASKTVIEEWNFKINLYNTEIKKLQEIQELEVLKLRLNQKHKTLNLLIIICILCSLNLILMMYKESKKK